MFTDDEAQDIVEHMNQDHADAVLLYAQVIGQCSNATSARMTDINSNGMRLEVLVAEQHTSISIKFDEPLLSLQDARRVLIKLARVARQEKSTN